MTSRLQKARLARAGRNKRIRNIRCGLRTLAAAGFAKHPTPPRSRNTTPSTDLTDLVTNKTKLSETKKKTRESLLKFRSSKLRGSRSSVFQNAICYYILFLLCFFPIFSFLISSLPSLLFHFFLLHQEFISGPPSFDSWRGNSLSSLPEAGLSEVPLDMTRGVVHGAAGAGGGPPRLWLVSQTEINFVRPVCGGETFCLRHEYRCSAIWKLPDSFLRVEQVLKNNEDKGKRLYKWPNITEWVLDDSARGTYMLFNDFVCLFVCACVRVWTENLPQSPTLVQSSQILDWLKD